jgi:hypothetical protein
MLPLTGASTTPLNSMARAVFLCARPSVPSSRPEGPASRNRLLHTFHNADDCFLFSIKEITSRLHRSCANCGELEFSQARRLSTGDSQVDNQGTNPGPCPQSGSRRDVVHRCPQAIHRLSTGFIPRPVDDVGTRPCRCPQILQQEIHRPPQAGDKDVTHSVCPHRFPQGLSTSVGLSVGRCPPVGDRACGRLWISVEKVGTKRTRPDVDKSVNRALEIRLRRASISGLSCEDLGITCGQPGA